MPGKKIGRPIRDLVGEKFNNFEVIAFVGPSHLKYKFLWKVRCICGKELDLMPLDLKRLKSCGCLFDLTGQKFNKLTVLKLDHEDSIKGRHWLVECECGTQKVLTTHQVKTIKSCGCLLTDKKPRTEYVGKRFGALVVEKYIKGAVGISAQCEVVCDCGARKTTSAMGLLQGHTKSCGCNYGEDAISTNSGKIFHSFKLLGGAPDVQMSSHHFVGVCLKCGTVRTAGLGQFKEGSALCYGKCAQDRHPWKQEIPEELGIKNCSIYRRWAQMMSRCHREGSRGYHRYGGRGIFVCEEWRDSLGFMRYRKWLTTKYPNWKELFDKKYQIDRIDNDKGYSPENCRLTTTEENHMNRRTTIKVEVNGLKVPLKAIAKDNSVVSYKTLCARIESGWSLEDSLRTPYNAKRGTR